MAQTQFTSVITDEAMQNINYGSGWTLKPYKFCVLNRDLLEEFDEKVIFDEEGNMKEQYLNILKNYTTKDLDADRRNGIAWAEYPFSGLKRVIAQGTELTDQFNDLSPSEIKGSSIIGHSCIIPGSHTIQHDSELVKTFVFTYSPLTGDPFVYAVARVNTTIVFEQGITQSFNFNFAVLNIKGVDNTNFVINYTYPQAIEDHNNPGLHDDYEGVHEFLLDRKGLRKAIGPLEYTETVTDCEDESFPLLGLVTKQYVKVITDELKRKIADEMCPPGTLQWWLGTPDTIPSGWTVRDGKLLEQELYPGLFRILQHTFEDEYKSAHNGTGYDKDIYFPIMDDRGLFIRGSQLNETSPGVYTNNGQLSGIPFMGKQKSGAPNIKGYLHHNFLRDGCYANGAFSIWATKDNGGSKGRGMVTRCLDLNASRCSDVYNDNVTEIRPTNRNYLPIIRLV